MRIATIIIALALAATTVIAAEQRIALKEGPGRDKIESDVPLNFNPLPPVVVPNK